MMAAFSKRVATQSVIATADMRNGLPRQASLAAKIPGSKQSDDRFLAMLGNHGDLDLALLDVKNRIRGRALRKDDLIFAVG
jgi:hypothetical protein